MAISHSRFVEQACYLAKNVSKWAGECAGDPQKTMSDDEIIRFNKMIDRKMKIINRMHQEVSDA